MRALIATDGSEWSLDAARHAVDVLRSDAEFVLVSVMPPREEPGVYAGGFEGPLISPDAAEDLHRAAVVQADAALAATARVFGAIPVEQRAAEGPAGEVICSLASELDVDVVVLGSHGRGLFMAALLGSVSAHVVHHCRRPVLVVPRAE